MNADTSGADNPVRVFLAANRSHAAGRRTRRLLAKDELQIRQHAPRRIDDVTLFSSDMERSLGRLTHGFLAVADWVGVRERLSPRDRRLLMRKAISLVESWRELADPETSMAFHDETTAQRTMNLVALRHDYRDVLDESQDAVLREVIDHDIALLSAADFYAGTNNHGMFQDIALLVAAALYDQATDPEGLRDLAVQRLVAYFSVCFTADGIHVENNPTYHVMVSRYLSRVIAYASTCGREADFGDLADVLDHAEEYAAHAVTPQGSFPPGQRHGGHGLGRDHRPLRLPGRAVPRRRQPREARHSAGADLLRRRRFRLRDPPQRMVRAQRVLHLLLRGVQRGLPQALRRAQRLHPRRRS
ncbi:MAG: hypothetical protein L0G94_02235 [Brachybacterium sp.]|uniref:heparinase II/III family protein n=1 Tax=Brachybacterium sp. TaxID=1891286 RepID=UPI002649089E|nr:heparinase II/III family protein [Brachybacterium sp.]MDN5685487.1 hypothetical protein [Brachybacterium sp.]